MSRFLSLVSRPFDTDFGVRLVAIIVGLHGIFIVAITLLDQIAFRHNTHITEILVDLPLLIGLSLIYLSSLLRRRKRTAWLVTVLAYAFYLGLNIANLVVSNGVDDVNLLRVIRIAVLPGLILLLLFANESAYSVKSDIQGFRVALRLSVIMLLIAFLYGVSGFMLLDKHDFHRQISFPTAAQYTVDQFNITTVHPIHPYTFRAKLFTTSLGFASFIALLYVALALFQPLRQRLTDQTFGRHTMAKLLDDYPAHSEDYFKLWPHDKHYFFDSELVSGVAYVVHRGTALCLGDPAGDPQAFSRLIDEFTTGCTVNDWTPAFVQVLGDRRKLYEQHGFGMQKIGSEAVLSVSAFQTTTGHNKYFRHIRNKFTKHGFTPEVLSPPHSEETIIRLREISDDWLSHGGREERGFAMGYFNEVYLGQCELVVVRDESGTIQAFMNLLPTPFDTEEATYDLLRYTRAGAGNINDFLLMSCIEYVEQRGYTHLNLGLCPLYGLDKDAEDASMIDAVLRFAYANGDRIYSFSGLQRFKAKYEPEWRDRYLVYRGGVRGLTRTTNALFRSLKVVS